MKNFNAGTYVSQGYYKSFQPTMINRQWYLENPASPAVVFFGLRSFHWPP